MQLSGLERKPHLLVATPGRLLDLWDENEVQLGESCTLLRRDKQRSL